METQTVARRMESKKVYEVVRKISKGRVATYGGIAEMVGISPRLVGQALHNNPDPERIPCHRVVDRNGRIAENFAFGGWREQRRRLAEEGIAFIDAMHVDLKKTLVDFEIRR